MKTIEVEGLPEDKVSYLEQLIRQWRAEEQTQAEEEAHAEEQPESEEEDVKPSDFIVKQSHIIGELTRAAAYEDD